MGNATSGADAGRERRTSREAVVEAALRVVDSEGVSSLSMRRVADEVGVAVMTLYGVVRGKQDLVQAVAESAFADLFKVAYREGPWPERLRALTGKLYCTLRDHPGVVEMVLTDAVPSSIFDKLRESTLAILHEAGLDRNQVRHALGGFHALALGFAVAEAARARRIHRDVDEVRRLKRLHPADYPHLTDLADAYPSDVSEEALAVNIEHLIAGFSPRPRTGTGSQRGRSSAKPCQERRPH